MKNLFFILVCLFISAELCAQGDESGNNPETPLNTNQLETSESSEENAEVETSELPADEERFESVDDPLAEEEDPFAEEDDPFANEDDPFADEEDPFSEEEDPFSGEPATDPTSEKSGESPELQSWQNYLDQKALILVNLMVRSHKTKERNTRLELAEKARQVIEEIDEEAQTRMEEERLSEEAYQDWNDHFQKRIETETAAAMASGDPESFISLFESGWFKRGYTPRLVLLYRLALEQRNESYSPTELPPRYSELVRLYQEILDLHEGGDSLLPVKERLEDQLEEASSILTDADLELALTIVNELGIPQEIPLVIEEEPLELMEPESIDNGTSEDGGLFDDLTELVEESSEVPFDAKVSFTHEINTLVGISEIKGLYLIDPEISTINEYKLSTTYSPQFRIQMSEKTYSFFRLSVTFTQSYEANQERFFDSLFTLREIYNNYRSGKHQVRYGTQIFKLGKVDFDSTIDTLHLNNIMRFFSTFDPDKQKESLTSVKYSWFGGEHNFNAYLAPIKQETFGMKFVGFRDSLEQQQEGKKEESSSIFRDYFGLQYQWTGDMVDARMSYFQWFDVDPTTSFVYDRSTSGGSIKTAFEGLMSSYSEKESRSNFFALELDALWKGMAWKLDAGFYNRKNFSSYHIENENKLYFNTTNAPYTAWATSFERTFPYFYWIMIYSQRKLSGVPAGTHVLFYENESSLADASRDLQRNQLTGIAVVKTPDNQLRVATIHYLTNPYNQRGWLVLGTWERPEDNYILEFKFYSVNAGYQKMLDSVLDTTQFYLVYTQKFAGF